MNIKETLTKENFWNQLYEKYPDGLKVFTDWIDQYKKAVNWNRMFNDGYSKIVIVNPGGKVNYVPRLTESPKFHDIPYAMQLGIWIEFQNDYHKEMWSPELLGFDLKHDIEEQISSIQKSIDDKRV